MQIPLAEYAKRNGRAIKTATNMASMGRFHTAVKIGRYWVIDESEPWPVAPVVERPKPYRSVVYVIQESDELPDEPLAPKSTMNIFITWDFDEAREMFEVQDKLAMRYNASPVRMGRCMRSVTLYGYSVIRKYNQPADDALKGVKDTDLVYSYSVDGEWDRRIK